MGDAFVESLFERRIKQMENFGCCVYYCRNIFCDSVIFMSRSYSVWLISEGKINEKLSAIISSLSKKYNSPLFEPHVTLIGGFVGDEKELLHKTEVLSRRIKPFNVKLTRTHQLNEFFRSFFILVEKTPELMNAYREAINVFGLSEDPDYMPHVSLIYGDFEPKIKENIVKEIGRDFNISFKAEKIHFVFNDERNKKWKRIASFPLED